MNLSKICYIYEIRNTISDKCYVGSTVDPKQRKQKHFYALRHGWHNSKLQRSYNKHGYRAFVFKVLTTCKLEERFVEETKRIAKLNSFENGYNMGPEALNHWLYSKTPEEVKEIFAKAKVNRDAWWSNRTKEQLQEHGRRIVASTSRETRLIRSAKANKACSLWWKNLSEEEYQKRVELSRATNLQWRSEQTLEQKLELETRRGKSVHLNYVNKTNEEKVACKALANANRGPIADKAAHAANVKAGIAAQPLEVKQKLKKFRSENSKAMWEDMTEEQLRIRKQHMSDSAQARKLETSEHNKAVWAKKTPEQIANIVALQKATQGAKTLEQKTNESKQRGDAIRAGWALRRARIQGCVA